MIRRRTSCFRAKPVIVSLALYSRSILVFCQPVKTSGPVPSKVG